MVENVRSEFGRSGVLIHPRPSHTKDFKNVTNCFRFTNAADLPILEWPKRKKKREIGS